LGSSNEVIRIVVYQVILKIMLMHIIIVVAILEIAVRVRHGDCWLKRGKAELLNLWLMLRSCKL